MENLSHSLRQSKLSRKSSHANAAAKGIYDDVFGGPPKFGAPAALSPRAEDYREIFGGFHAPRVSSIPVLDLPVVDEREVYFDVRSPGFDYSEVFGGFRGLDLGDGNEELFGRRRSGSSDEAWTPESLSEESDHSISNQYPLNGDSHHLVNGNIEYNISYHKANLRSDEEIASGLRRTAEIHAVPGYSYMVDHSNSYQGKEKEKHLKKTRSDNSNGRNDVRRQKDFERNSSCPGETFMTISEVSLRTDPSHLPPPSRPPPGDINGPVSSWNAGYVEGDGDDNSTSSPLFFDVEVDGSSSAAAVASAAAMKEAMMKAGAQLRSAKELMEKKKETRQNRARMGYSGELGDMGRESHSEERVQGTNRGKSSEMKTFIVEEPRDVMGTRSAIQDSTERENFQVRPKQSAKKVRGKESAYNEMFGYIEEADEWKEATQFFELVKGDRSEAVHSQTNKEKDMSENVRTRDNGEMEGTTGRSEGLDSFNSGKAKVGKRVSKEEGVADSKTVNSKAAIEATIDKNVEEKEEAGQAIGQWEEAKKKHRKIHHATETAVKLNGSDSSEDRESLNDILTEVAREFEIRQVMERKRDVLKPKKSSRRLEAKENVTDGKGCNERRPKEPLQRVEKDRRPEFIAEAMGNEERCPEFSRQETEDYRQRANLESAWEEANEREENARRFKKALELEESEKRTREVLEQEKRNKLKEAHEREENEKRMKAKLELAERKREQEAAAREVQERRLRETLEREENEKRLREAHEQAERKKLIEALAREEKEKKLREAREQEEKQQRRKEALEKQEKEKMLREALEKEEKEKMLRAALEKEEKEKMLREALEKEEKEKMLREALEKEEKEKMLREALEKEEKEKMLREALEKEEKEKMLRAALEKEEKSEKRLLEAREREAMRKRLEEAKEMENESSLREARNREHIEERNPEAKGREKSENSHQEASQKDDDTSNSRDSCTNERDHDQGEIDDASRDTFELEELDKWLKEAVDVEEPDVLNEADTKAEAFVQNDTENIQSDFPASGSKQVLRESPDGIDASDDDSDQSRAESQASENKFSATESKDNESKTEDSIESPAFVDRPTQTNPETTRVSSQMRNESRHQEESRPTQEWGETKENANKSEAGFGEDGKRVESQPPIVNAHRTSRQSQDARQAEGRKENKNGKVKLRENEAERLRREQEIEKERLRKIEEEKEREREREKDRMGIDRATLEARERAYAETRERAERAAVERATAEARQRSLAEARERLEKACAEARERSLFEKSSAEARIRAERAAVERATAEARERAASRYNGMRQSSLPSDLRESQHPTAGSSSSTRYQHSSGYGAPCDVEKSEGVEGESAQRCRARLERHRRTAERAAKALAEKNMRDLQAQREQAERNRLSETLDADVKRWSSGKEGNLRALLSTLQYILGPDSGWQPVPLTEVITTVAVKKAYRKATLCVHPDKLQQRGASIQQKYICEKVFDLLKEAWNKFNSEER